MEWVVVKQELPGVQMGRLQAQKGRVAHAKDFVRYPAGCGEHLKDFQWGKNIWYLKIILNVLWNANLREQEKRAYNLNG